MSGVADVAGCVAVFADFVAGVLADVGYAAQMLIFSGDSVAVALGLAELRRHAALPFLQAVAFCMVGIESNEVDRDLIAMSMRESFRALLVHI